MRCTYELLMTGICPVDNTLVDAYQVTVTCRHEVMVERLREHVALLGQRIATQEEQTQALADAFPGCTITSIGWHSGVRTTVACP
jgi:hypothetical protein